MSCLKKRKLNLLSEPQNKSRLNIEGHEATSQNSNLMLSHENINIEFNLSSGDVNCSSKSNHNLPMTDDGRELNVNNKFEETKEIKCNSQQLLLDDSDDYLLENIDLSFQKERHVTGRNKNEYICSYNDKNFYIETDKNVLGQSPDIFNSNQETDNYHPDERAWDMSIRVLDHESGENQNNYCDTDGLSQIVLDTWVSSPKQILPKEDNSKNVSSLLTNTLKNNAFKNVQSVSSPRLLLPLPINKSNDTFFGLPKCVKILITHFKGITSLYDWQEECLNLLAIEKRKNLVYALPTSGGKTLVAEILLLKEILCREKNVLFILPYVSIAQEKVRALSPFAVELGFLVEEFAGSKGSYPPQKRRRKRSVYVATIEKGLGLVHSLIECQRIDELGLIIVDELHLIGEPKRGANLESMLTKLIYIKGDIQIIGMSATIGNLSDVAKFLNAEVYTQDFRPVELTEYVKVKEELFRVDHSIKNEVPLVFKSKVDFQYSQEQKQQDPDQIGALVQEVIPNHSCLVFCPSKKNCENVALLICNTLNKKFTEHNFEEKKALYNALRAEGNGSVCSILRKTLPYGVAYHHSGLTTAERSLLEEAFLAKTICCICCTSTLAAGVNLPARRVILRSPYIGNKMLNLSKYKQMIGRAGRMGMGEVGESYLLCKEQDAEKIGELLSSSMDVCNSQLQGNGLLCLIISAIDLGLTPTLDSLIALCQCSLLAIQEEALGVDIKTEVHTSLQTLIKAGGLQMNGSNLSLSKIGKAAVKANMDIETAKRLYGELLQAQDSLVLLSHLHLLYLVTPYTMMDQIRFNEQIFCTAYMELGAKEIKTASVLGIGEHCIAQLRTGRTVKASLTQVLHRFYLSLILFDLWNQNSLWKVSNKYSLPRGLVHNFLLSTSAFSSSVIRFCEVLDDMWCFKLLLADISVRLTHCCSAELLPLLELPAVKIGRAKQLYNAGFKTISILATTEPKALVQAVDHMPRRVAHQIVAAAKLMLLAKAESLQEEAEDVLKDLHRVSL